jgi:hypothetical protein
MPKTPEWPEPALVTGLPSTAATSAEVQRCYRGILIWKCEDLTAKQLRRRAVPPSTLSLLGLVRHTAEVERGWFRHVFLGENVPDLYDRSADEDGFSE